MITNHSSSYLLIGVWRKEACGGGGGGELCGRKITNIWPCQPPRGARNFLFNFLSRENVFFFSKIRKLFLVGRMGGGGGVNVPSASKLRQASCARPRMPDTLGYARGSPPILSECVASSGAPADRFVRGCAHADAWKGISFYPESFERIRAQQPSSIT